MPYPYFLYMVVGFISGSVMYSYLLPKLLFGVDIVAASEDHNPGMSNALRLTGPVCGGACLILDMLKGFAPVYLASRQLNIHHVLFSLVIAAPVLGHAFSLFMRFYGGKAISTSFGVLLGIANFTPIVWVLALCFIFFSLVVVVRPDALRVVVSFITATGVHWYFFADTVFLLAVLLIAATVVFRHLPSLWHVPKDVRFFWQPRQ